MTTGTTASGTFYSYKKKDQEIPIVFVHGVGLNHEIWKPQLDFFNNYSTLAYDILGHGKSSLDKEIISFDVLLLVEIKILPFFFIFKDTVSIISFIISVFILYRPWFPPINIDTIGLEILDCVFFFNL